MSEKAVYRTPKGRFTFPNVFTPRPAMEAGKQDLYECGLIISKEEDISELNKIVDDLIKAKWGAKPPAGLKRPVRDGAEKAHLAGYGEGTIFITAKTKHKPPVVDAHKVGITDEQAVYGGAWGRLSITPYTFDKGTSKGVALALNAVQKLGDGEPFAGRMNPDDLFDEEEEVMPWD